jgi:UDP-glucose 4-epimerase
VDLGKPDSLNKLDSFPITHVVHLAGLIPAKLEAGTGVEFFAINTIGTLNLVNYLKKHSIVNFVFTTTLYEVIEHKRMPISEDMGRCFSIEGDHALYVNSKIAATDVLHHYSRSLGFNLIILRFTGLLGYGRQEGHWSNGKFHKSAFETFYEHAINGRDMEVWGNGEKKRDSLYVKDAVSAVIKASRCDIANGVTLNIASGSPTSIMEEVTFFRDVFPQARIKILPEKRVFQREYFFDISLAKNLLNWEPTFDFRSIVVDYHQTRIDQEGFNKRM